MISSRKHAETMQKKLTRGFNRESNAGPRASYEDITLSAYYTTSVEVSELDDNQWMWIVTNLNH